jgi:hypothetical protein
LEFESVFLLEKTSVLSQERIKSAKGNDEFAAAVFLQHKTLVLTENVSTQHGCIGATGLTGEQPIERYAE